MIFTFYGFKGGVGRTLAVVHAATILASTRGPHGISVLVMDLDLEAPSAFLYLPPVREGLAQPGRGFVELMAEFLDDRRDADWLRQELPKVIFEAAPSLFVLPSGNYTDPKYLETAQRLDEAFEAGFFQALKAACDTLYDYVLIDSRTGLAEIAAAATILMGDVLVACFRPNQANLGVGMIVQRFLAHNKLRKDDPGAPIIPLLTPRPASHSLATARWRSFFQEEFFGPNQIIQIPFDASLETGDAMIIRPGSLTARLEDGHVMSVGDEISDLTAPIIAAYIEVAERLASFNTDRDVIAARKAELAAFLDQRYVDALGYLFQALRRQPDSREHWNTLMRRYVPAVLDAAAQETPARELIRHFLSECLGDGPKRLDSSRGRAWAHIIRAAKFGKGNEDGMADVEAALALSGDSPDIANDANFLAAQIIRFRNEKSLRAGDGAAFAARSQELRQALRYLEQAVASGGETERIARFCGEIHRELGDYAAAVNDFDHAALLTSAPAEALLDGAQTLEHSGRYGDAVRRYLAAVKAAPYNEEVYRRFVPTLYRLGYFDEARHRLDQWRRMNAVSPEPSRYALGLAVTSGDPREIEEWLAIVQRQQAPSTRIVAWALLRLARYEEAQTFVVDHIDAGAYERFQLVLAFASLGQDTTAILALPAESAAGGNYLALAAAAAGMFDIARSHIESCLAYEEGVPLAWRTNLQFAEALIEAAENPASRKSADALLAMLRNNVENAQWTRHQVELQMIRQIWGSEPSRTDVGQARWDEIMRAWDAIELVPFEQFEPFDVPLQPVRRTG